MLSAILDVWRELGPVAGLWGRRLLVLRYKNTVILRHPLFRGKTHHHIFR